MSEEIWKDFPEAKGRVIKSISGLEVGSKAIFINFEDGDRIKMYHCQECCESVQVEDCEDVSSDDLKESIIHTFEEYTKSSGESGWGLQTYTFYRLITNSAYCTIRWFGESNGYYGVGVRVVLEVKGGKDKVLSDGYAD